MVRKLLTHAAPLIKAGVVWLGIRRILPASWAHWIINVLGLRHL